VYRERSVGEQRRRQDVFRQATNGSRSRPHGASGAVACMQIAPRDYHFTVCDQPGGCGRRLFFTYVGEDCPHCGTRVKTFVEGNPPRRRD
jgi:hypothetical protein